MAVLPIKSMNFMINFIHMGIRWADRVSNKEIWKRTGQVLVGGENGERHTLKSKGIVSQRRYWTGFPGQEIKMKTKRQLEKLQR